jgi:hypothetical protein
MINWEFYSSRKGITLSKFLRNVTSLEGALELFDVIKIQPPPDEEILLALGLIVEDQPEVKTKVEDQPEVKTKSEKSQEQASSTKATSSPARHQPKVRKKRRAPKKLASNPPKSNEKEKAPPKENDKKYFRKVFPAKDKQ